ncbi:MAG: hypothetical protein A2562_01615 [Candidatus Nealsonbacteria bacterium RIFOXYD1_FULL_39_11]|nr:MAG: hypothetical protein A2562_01615 [Candidatus Nealsonbacteria bacterium RIFOXYD1_FULL_39_11]
MFQTTRGELCEWLLIFVTFINILGSEPFLPTFAKASASHSRFKVPEIATAFASPKPSKGGGGFRSATASQRPLHRILKLSLSKLILLKKLTYFLISVRVILVCFWANQSTFAKENLMKKTLAVLLVVLLALAVGSNAQQRSTLEILSDYQLKIREQEMASRVIALEEKIAELESQTQNLNKEHAAFYQLLKNRMEPNCPPVADVRMKELEKKMDKLNEENVKMREVLVGILNSDRRSAAATTTSAPPAVLEDSGKTGWMDFSLPSPNHMRGEIRFSTDKIREPNLPLPEPHPIAPGVDLPISTKALWWGAVFVVILLLLVIAAAIFWGRKRRALPRRAARVEPPADDRD